MKRRPKSRYGTQSCRCPKCARPSRVTRTVRTRSVVLRHRVCEKNHAFTTEEKPR